jgi:hypothetical protein
LLGQDPKHCMCLVPYETRPGISFVLDRSVDPQLITVIEETKWMFLFVLKLVSSMFDTSLFPVVHCMQYRDKGVRAVNILIEIDQNDLSTDLVLASLETMLKDYMIK